MFAFHKQSELLVEPEDGSPASPILRTAELQSILDHTASLATRTGMYKLQAFRGAILLGALNQNASSRVHLAVSLARIGLPHLNSCFGDETSLLVRSFPP